MAMSGAHLGVHLRHFCTHKHVAAVSRYMGLLCVGWWTGRCIGDGWVAAAAHIVLHYDANGPWPALGTMMGAHRALCLRCRLQSTSFCILRWVYCHNIPNRSPQGVTTGFLSPPTTASSHVCHPNTPWDICPSRPASVPATVAAGVAVVPVCAILKRSRSFTNESMCYPPTPAFREQHPPSDQH